MKQHLDKTNAELRKDSEDLKKIKQKLLARKNKNQRRFDMFFEIEGTITGVSLYENTESSITITSTQPSHAIQKITLEISNKAIAKAIAQTHGIDKPFKITICNPWDLGGDKA